MATTCKRVAIVGIDGAGKSTIVTRLIELAHLDPLEVGLLTCPRYHDAPNAPLGRFSRAIDAFSRVADQLGSYELKSAALYLQMTLFGPVERFVADAFAPRLLIEERHALVDTLAYAPLYLKAVRGAADRSALAGPLAQRLEAEEKGAWSAVQAWTALEARRLEEDVDLFDLPARLLEVFQAPPEAQLVELSRRYRTALPDALILLDLPAETALGRVAEREGARELHERVEALERLRRSYFQVVRFLAASHPAVSTHIVDAGGDTSPDEVIEEVLAVVRAE